MVMVSNAHAFAYFCLPKTGSSTMADHLKVQYGARSMWRHHAAQAPYPDHFLCWTTVRNPWIRLISWWSGWRNSRTPGRKDNPHLSYSCTFEQFLAYFVAYVEGQDLHPTIKHLRYPQHRFAAQQPCTRIVHLERMAEEFAELPFAITVPSGRKNKGDWQRRGPPTQIYSQEAIDSAIEYGVLDDCKAFGYPPDIPE